MTVAVSTTLYDTSRAFEIVSDFIPAGDQPEAIDRLADGIGSGVREQVLLGVTGSGKTFSMANVIQQLQRPTRSCCRTTKRWPHCRQRCCPDRYSGRKPGTPNRNSCCAGGNVSA